MLSKFLNFNRQCPLCEEPLSLYMQWTDSICFKAKMLEPNLYQFDPLLGTNKDKTTDDCWMDHMLLLDKGDTIETQFSSNKLFNESKKFQVYFFFLCNPAGIKKKTWGDWEINMYKACYYRSTLNMEFQRTADQEEKSWELKFTNPEHQALVQKNETFMFHSQNNDIEKVYLLDLDYEAQKTDLKFYSVSDEQKKIAKFKPNIFEKTVPLLKNRPNFNFEQRERLIERLDSWIIMS